MLLSEVRDYSKRGDALPVPNLVEVQRAAYERCLQLSCIPGDRGPQQGLEGLLHPLPVQRVPRGRRRVR